MTCTQSCNQGRSCTCGIRAYTWRWVLVTLVAFWLLLFCSVKAFASVEEVATSTNTFAVCKAVDVASTAYLIDKGLAVEANPIVRPLIANGYFPFVLLSIGMWWVLDKLDNKPATAVANVLTCGVAVHNLVLIP